jgi:hypothetical protein
VATALNNNVAHPASRPSPRAVRVPAVAIAALAVTVTAAACGGGAAPGVASLARSHATQPSGSATSGGVTTSSGGGLSVHAAIKADTRKAALKFAECMRANGVSDFPDPNASGGFQFSAGGGSGIDPRSTTFQSAMQKCRKYLAISSYTPAQLQAEKAAAVRFSQCMRRHGVANYPDPQFGPGGRVALQVGGSGSGLDPNSPIFQRAMETCGGRKIAGGGK